MQKKLVLISLIYVIFALFTYGQVKIRLFSCQSPESALFSVNGGRYELQTFNGEIIQVNLNEFVLITRCKGQLAVKTTKGNGFFCDSLILTGKTGNDFFTLRVSRGTTSVRQLYSGDLQCFSDLGTIVMINNSNVESYIAGVVQAEGGRGRNKEYCNTQAILARTYMYKYSDKHLSDRYNVCDDIHCQAFNGISSDSVINRAVSETKGLVIMNRDNTLISSAFHSNCGGETTSSGDVWLTSEPYLTRKADPYCTSSHNAVWEKRISMKEWIEFLRRSGYQGKTDVPAAFTFIQKTRQNNYRTGSFFIPLIKIRSELNLKSTFFSVFAEGDSIVFKGRGYGHGVGLCQEGAMVMANSGSNYRQIIDFYYSNVRITDIKNALFLTESSSPKLSAGGF